MKTWDDWTDEDLSHAILIAIHGEVINHFCLSDCETYVYDCGVVGESFYRVDLIDINNPADMWPIIFDNGICLTSPTKGRKSSLWSASWNEDGGKWSSGDIVFGDKNPLRAAAIVFLMMNGIKAE